METKARTYRIGVPDGYIIAATPSQPAGEGIWQVAKPLAATDPNGRLSVEPCVCLPQMVSFREVGLCDIAVMEISQMGEEKWVSDPDGAVVRSQMRVNEVAGAMKKLRNG